MKKVFIIILVIVAWYLLNLLHDYQTRNMDNVTPEQMHEITLIKNGIKK